MIFWYKSLAVYQGQTPDNQAVQSEEFKEELATKINKKIDIPFVDEEKEQIFFEKCVDLVTDILEGFFKGK